MVAYDPQTRLYSIGTESLRLAALILGRDSWIERCRPLVRDLAARLRETCAFSLYEPQTFTKVMAIVERGPHPLGYDYDVGRRDDLHAGASGKAILAFLPDEEIDALLRAPLSRATERTIVNPRELRKQIAEIRARGYATSLGERVPGAGFGIGAPVFGPDGRVRGSIVVTIPLFRWRDSRLPSFARAVVECGRALSAALDGASRP